MLKPVATNPDNCREEIKTVAKIPCFKLAPQSTCLLLITIIICNTNAGEKTEVGAKGEWTLKCVKLHKHSCTNMA